MTFRKIETFIIVAIIAVVGIIYAFTQAPLSEPVADNTILSSPVEQSSEQPNSQQSVVAEKKSGVIQYQGVEGKNALELLKASYQIQSKEYSGLGEFVESINGITPDKDQFWSFYVNGKQAAVGASAYITKNGDVIEWKLEKVGEYK
jgi:hypothetical protein